MKDGKASMNRRTKAILAVAAVAIMIIAVIPVFSSDSSADLESYQTSITYNSNNGQSKTRTIIYDGIASTEYNPEYWEGTGHVPTDNTVYMREVNPVNGELVKNGNNPVYYQLPEGDNEVGNLAAYVDDNGKKRLFDPFIDGDNYNWKGASVSVTVTITGVTIRSAVSEAVLPDDLTIVSVTNSSGAAIEGLTGSRNVLYYDGETDLFNIKITVTLSTNKVFSGWNTVADGLASGLGHKYLPGDVILPGDTTLYAQWITPDVYYNKTGAEITDNSTNNIYCKAYVILEVNNNGSLNTSKNAYLVQRGDNQSDSMYGTIYKIRDETAAGKALGALYQDANHSVSATKAYIDAGNQVYLYDGTPITLTEEQKANVLYSNKDNGTVANQTQLNDGTKLYVYRGSAYRTANKIVLNNIQLELGTYRSENPGCKDMLYFDNSNASLKGDTIIDDVGIDASGGAKKHGGTSNSALFANGHVLIMGVGITNPNLTGNQEISADNVAGAPQIFGAKINAATTDAISSTNVQLFNGKKRYVFAEKDNQGDNITEDFYAATCVIIHSGIYKTVCGGGFYTIGQDSNAGYRSTYLVVRGGTIGDTVVGGNCGSNISIHSTGSSATGSPSDMRYGGTFTYFLGKAFAAGDNWEDKMTGDFYRIAGRDTFLVKENTILTAGSRLSNVWGTAHLFISGDASVWVANGANREESGYTRVGMLDISGSAVIRHAAAGTTANAKKTDDGKGSVKGVWLIIRDNATVAMALGGGYDVYNDPFGMTMIEGTVNVYVEGGTVGNVYGGGYRGCIGTPSIISNLTVNVTVNGGTVEGNVYGGGCGGLDRGQHAADGSPGRNTNLTSWYSEGASVVYGNVNVAVNGGTVEGNVYGGGMSAPMVSEYNYHVDGGSNVRITNFKTTSMGFDTAAVYGKVTVSVSGGDILGSVYGGGEGLNIQKSGSNDCIFSDDYSRFKVVKRFGGELTIDTIPWYANGTATYKTANMYSTYLKFAMIESDTNRDGRVDGEATVVAISKSAHIAGGVFGGGCNGYVNGNRYVNIACTGTADGQDYNVDNSVYGGSSVGSDNYDSLVIISSGWLKSSVFGGGFMGKTDGNTNVYIGYDFDDELYMANKKTLVCSTPILIEGSVFAGADVKEGSSFPYSEALVLKEGHVFVYGKYSSITIKGCIMGDGNSCLTRGWKEIRIESWISGNKLSGIHRANRVTITNNSEIPISGREARVYDKVPITRSNVYYGNNHTQANDSQINAGTDLYYRIGEGNYIPLDLGNVYEYIPGGYAYTDEYHSGEDVIRLDYYQLSEADAKSTLIASGTVYVPDTTGSNQLIKMASLFRIGLLELQGSSTIKIDNPAEDVRAYSSLGNGGSPTVYNSPLNKIEFASGGSFYVREEITATITNYGIVTGYTQVSISNQGSYGAYVFGSESSTGGFVVSKNGQYEYTNVTNFPGAVPLKCWFLAGTEYKTLSMSLPNTENSVSSSMTVAKLQSNTQMEYAGGYYIPSSAGYEFVRPNATGGSAYSLAFGYQNGTDRSLIAQTTHFRGNGTAASAGTYFLGNWIPQSDAEYSLTKSNDRLYAVIGGNNSPVYYYDGTYKQVDNQFDFTAGNTLYVGSDYKEAIVILDNSHSIPQSIIWSNVDSYYAVSASPSLEDKVILDTYEMDGGNFVVKSGNGVYSVYFQFRGTPTNSTIYLGYALIYIKEFETVTYKVGDEVHYEQMVVNTMEIHIDLYVQGSSSGDEDHSVVLDAVYNDNTTNYQGTSDLLIQSSHNNSTFKVVSITGSADGNANLPSITISGVGNINGTNGWMESHERTFAVNRGPNSYNSNNQVGILQGSYYATLRLAINSGSVPSGLSYTIVCKIHDPHDGDSTQNDVTVTITVTVTTKDFVTITFHDSNYSAATSEQRTAGADLIIYKDAQHTMPATKREILGLDAATLYLYDGTLAQQSDIDAVLFVKNNLGIYELADYQQRHDAQTTLYVHTNSITVKEFRYGSTITESDCPSTSADFSGWYLDSDYITLYNYNTRLTEPFDLYARHSHSVTFDYADGTSLSVVPPQVEGEITISKPSNPYRGEGYMFTGWYTLPYDSYIWIINYSKALFVNDNGYRQATAEEIEIGTGLYRWTGSAFVALDPQVESDFRYISAGTVYYSNYSAATNEQRTAGADLVLYTDAQHTMPATKREILGLDVATLYLSDGSLAQQSDIDAVLFVKNNLGIYELADYQQRHDAQTTLYVHTNSGTPATVQQIQNCSAQNPLYILDGKWDFETDYIEENTTLYARWEGKPITINFELPNGTTLCTPIDAKYGDSLSGILAAARTAIAGGQYSDILSGFQYWEYQYVDQHSQTIKVRVYDYMILDSNTIVNYTSSMDEITLIAITTVKASTSLEVRVDAAEDPLAQSHNEVVDGYGNVNEKWKANSYLATASVEDYVLSSTLADYSIYKTYIYEFNMNGATKPGHTLTGWYNTSNVNVKFSAGEKVIIVLVMDVSDPNEPVVKGEYIVKGSGFVSANSSMVNNALYYKNGNDYIPANTQQIENRNLTLYVWNGNDYSEASAEQRSSGKMLFVLDDGKYVLPTAEQVQDDNVQKYYFDCSVEGAMIVVDEDLDDYYVGYGAEWEEITYTVKVSNNTYGYMVVSDTYNNPVHKGDEFTATYGTKVYLFFNGSNGQTLDRWIAVGACTIGQEEIAGINYWYAIIEGDCTITASVDIREIVFKLPLKFEDNTNETGLLDGQHAPMIYLVRDGAYIAATGDQIDAGTGLYYKQGEDDYVPASRDQIIARANLYVYRSEEYIQMQYVENTVDGMLYKGFVGDGTYSLCVYDGTSYYRIANNIEVEDGETNAEIGLIRLIYLLSEPIHPSNNLYDMTVVLPLYDNDEIHTTYGSDAEGYVLIVGGYGFTIADNRIHYVDVDHATKKLVLDSITTTTYIVLTDVTYDDAYQPHHEVKRQIIIDVAKKRIYIIGKSDSIRQGEVWVPWGGSVGYVTYNMTEDDLALFTITNSINVNTNTPGMYSNTITYSCSSSNYYVVIVDGNVIVYRSESSTVTADLYTPLNRNMGLEQQPAPLSIDQISEMARAESAGNVMAVIGQISGRRL